MLLYTNLIPQNSECNLSSRVLTWIGYVLKVNKGQLHTWSLSNLRQHSYTKLNPVPYYVHKVDLFQNPSPFLRSESIQRLDR